MHDDIAAKNSLEDWKPDGKTAADLDGSADRWLDPAVTAEITGWAAEQVERHRDTPVREAELVQVRPWGAVYRLTAGGEAHWCKANAEGGAHEPGLMRWLHGLVGDRVPATIASNDARGWWLAVDAGTSLAARAPRAIPLAIWQEVLAEYSALQRRVETDVAGAMAAGLPVQGPSEAPEQFAELLDDERLLLVGDPRGLSVGEHAALCALQPEYEAWCSELASANIPITVQHDDLSEANVCHRDGFAFIDWADAYVGHPFGSTIFPERVFRKQHRLPADHPDVAALRHGYLEAWIDVHDLATLSHLHDLAVRVATAAKARSWTRALHGVPRDRLNSYYASPEARWLRKLLAR